MVAGVVVCLLLIHYLMGGIAVQPMEFDASSLNPPLLDVVARETDHPGPLGMVVNPLLIRTTVSYTPNVYAFFGGVLELFVENQGPNRLYAHHYWVRWSGGDETYSVNCSRLIGPGSTTGLGVLHFSGPGKAGSASLEVWMEVWASSVSGDLWQDKGDIRVRTLDLTVLGEAEKRDWELQNNPIRYYNKVNGLIDLDAVSGYVEQVRAAVPGNYSMMQLIKAYEMVRNSIDYALDEEDHWQSPAETIALGYGDCEDHALLLASMVTGLGGTCRVNLIPGHAFITVYVGGVAEVDDVIASIQTYYGHPIPVHYTLDDLGCWLVMDTNGLPYVGGYPAATSPAGGRGGTNWNLDDGDRMMLIDVTGRTANWRLF